MLIISPIRDSGAITADEALRVVLQDAEAAYGDLDDYAIRICRQADGWHIDFELTDSGIKGGGPHYVVDARSGAVASRRYEQ